MCSQPSAPSGRPGGSGGGSRPVPQPASRAVGTGAAAAPANAATRLSCKPRNHHIRSSAAASRSYSLRSTLVAAERAVVARLRQDVAPVEHHREQRAHALDAIDLLARQRLVALVLGEGDEEFGVLGVGGEDEVAREVIGRRDRRATGGDGENVVPESDAVFGPQMVLQRAERL